MLLLRAPSFLTTACQLSHCRLNRCSQDAFAVAFKCHVKNWSGLTCEVSSARSAATWYKVNLGGPVHPETICNHGCMENRVGVCPHVVAAVQAKNHSGGGTLTFKEFLPQWQWLDTWAEQLGVPITKVSDDDDMSYFPLPTLSDVSKLMQSDTSLDRTCVTATTKLKGQVGRMKGSAEEMGKKTQRLAREVAKGAVTGVDTTPLDAPVEKKEKQRVCKTCTTDDTAPVFQTVCGGNKNSHLGSEIGRRKAQEALDLETEKAEAHNRQKQQKLQAAQKKLHEAKALSMPPPPPLASSPTPRPTPRETSMPPPSTSPVGMTPPVGMSPPEEMTPRPSSTRPKRACTDDTNAAIDQSLGRRAVHNPDGAASDARGGLEHPNIPNAQPPLSCGPTLTLLMPNV